MRTLLSWSGGKDSVLALQSLREAGATPVGLLTTLTEGDGRVSHHQIPASLVTEQATAIGLPLHTVQIPDPCPNELYEQRLRAALERLEHAQPDAVAFGDVALADVRAYREQLLGGLGLAARFPLWGQDSAELARRFVAEGGQAIVCVVDTEQLDEGFIGRWFDTTFLDDLPAGVDRGGEHGEFHTFVTDAPVLDRAVPVVPGTIRRDGRFAWLDLGPSRT